MLTAFFMRKVERGEYVILSGCSHTHTEATRTGGESPWTMPSRGLQGEHGYTNPPLGTALGAVWGHCTYAGTSAHSACAGLATDGGGCKFTRVPVSHTHACKVTCISCPHAPRYLPGGM